MKTKIRALEGIKSWSPVQIPKTEKILHPKFVLRRKRDEKGVIKRYKARLVLRGSVEQDFNEDF